MSRKSLSHLECAVANTVELVNDAWTVLVLRDAFLGVRRFDDFANDLGIARNVLTDRLERLVGAGCSRPGPTRTGHPVTSTCSPNRGKTCSM